MGHQKLKETQIVVVAAGHSKPGLPDGHGPAHGHAHWNIGHRQPHYFGSKLNYFGKIVGIVGDIQPPYPHDRLCSPKVSGWLPEKKIKNQKKITLV